ncbi:MAG: hypothetical protein HY695_20020 [Deltaproteobacteria bacterium]|nr:hypothetical protein [Deltaproteobacteria bacterium]
MIAALLILFPVVGVVAWAFFRFAPIHADRKAVRRFNLLSVTVALFLAGAWVVRTYLVMSPTVDSAWWPVISVLGALLIVPLVLGLAAILRKFVIVRRGSEVSRQ